jgi:HD-GYP domain-containing protein (c-di-GMP phosphodiesterase class II)
LSVTDQSLWPAVLAAEPGAQMRLSSAALGAALEALGDVADLHARGATGHARLVAGLAAGAAQHCVLPATDVTALRHAGLVEDLGMLVSAATPGAKFALGSEAVQERIRLHPYYTERVFAHAPALAPIGALAALHHEQLDGGGFFRGLSAPQLPLTARILAAADAYVTLTESNTDNSTLTVTVADRLHEEVRAGGLDGEAVSAVLAAAGHRTRLKRRTRIAGLSDREIEVLRLLSDGLLNQQVAAQLGISAHTVDHHIRHIYNKIEVSSRAEATRFAVRHEIVLHRTE